MKLCTFFPENFIAIYFPSLVIYRLISMDEQKKWHRAKQRKGEAKSDKTMSLVANLNKSLMRLLLLSCHLLNVEMKNFPSEITTKLNLNFNFD